MTNTASNPSLLPEPPAQEAVASTGPELSDADKAAAEQAEADKLAADQAIDDKAASTPAPAKAKKARRGPPADGVPEKRTTVILTTSRLSDTSGTMLRRGRAVSVPERRVHRLVASGKVKEASESAIASALKLGPLVELG